MPVRGIVLCLIVAAALAAGADATAEDKPERVYRWTDAAGQESFSNNIQKVPEPFRSRYLAEDNAERDKAKARARQDKNQEDVKRAIDTLKARHAAPGQEGAPAGDPPSKTVAPAPPKEPAPKVKEGAAKKKPANLDFKAAPRAPFQDYRPADTRHEEAAATAYQESLKKTRDGMEELKALLKKKIEEMNLAAGWEMILHTPKFKQNKLRLMDEIEKVKQQIKDNEKRLEELTKQKPADY